MTDPARMILVLMLAAVAAVGVCAEWTIVGMLLRQSGMPHGRWACGVVTGLLLVAGVGVVLVVVQALGMA